MWGQLYLSLLSPLCSLHPSKTLLLPQSLILEAQGKSHFSSAVESYIALSDFYEITVFQRSVIEDEWYKLIPSISTGKEVLSDKRHAEGRTDLHPDKFCPWGCLCRMVYLGGFCCYCLKNNYYVKIFLKFFLSNKFHATKDNKQWYNARAFQVCPKHHGRIEGRSSWGLVI